jgi:predicted DCC family thiol-disulfide oxidoreductase YuxK
MTKPIKNLIVIYDGECPFCSQYVKHVRLRDVSEKLQYVNARDGGPIVAEALQQGFDLNVGMVVLIDGTYHHGADAVRVLAMLSSPVNALNWLHARIFSSRTVSHLLYPIMRFGRNTTLRLLGREKLTTP